MDKDLLSDGKCHHPPLPLEVEGPWPDWAADLEQPVASERAARAEVLRLCAHYENFSLASVFLPRHLRPALRSIYAFARFSDDLADEDQGLTIMAQRLGWTLPQLRRARLQHWVGLLEGLPQTAQRHPVLFCLWADAQGHHLPLDECRKLLEAFLQDQEPADFPNDQAVLDYCRNSAAPVGRLLLALNGIREEHAHWEAIARASDAVCAGLQLANFWQDLSRDLPAGRLYIPAQRLAEHGLAADVQSLMLAGDRISPLVGDLLDWAQSLLDEGQSLAAHLPWRFALEIRLYCGGGQAVLKACRRLGPALLDHRPTVGRLDLMGIGVKALLSR